MKPFYQGKIDTFCALYAVLNALRLTHSIRTLKARELFNDTLMRLAAQPQNFLSVLEQTTDYVDLVDEMIAMAAKRFPLRVQIPFAEGMDVSVARFWASCCSFINAARNRTAIFRFQRFFKPDQDPVVRHWTTIARITEESLDLYDSSHEAESIQHLQSKGIVTRREDVNSETLIFVQPETVRLLSLPF